MKNNGEMMQQSERNEKTKQDVNEGKQRRDGIFILILLAAACLLIIGQRIYAGRAAKSLSGSGAERQLVITIDNEEVFRSALSADAEEMIRGAEYIDESRVFAENGALVYRADGGGENIFAVEADADGVLGVRCTDADCPDQVCVRTGRITLASDLIVCLPHRLTARIV